MTIVPPIPPIGPLRPVGNVTPFTARDGDTYLSILHELRNFINNDLLPAVLKYVGDNSEFLTKVVNELSANVNDSIAQLELNVSAQLSEQDDKITQQLDDQSQLVLEQLSTNLARVNEAVQQVVNSSIELQDPVAAALVNDLESATRVALSLNFAPQGVRGWAFDAVTYGAVIDGPEASSTSIQAAIDAASLPGPPNPGGASAREGNIVRLPAGYFLIDEPLVINSNGVKLVGAGRTATVIMLSESFPENTPAIILGNSSKLVFGSRIESLTIDCRDKLGSTGIDMQAVQEGSGVSDVRVRGYRKAGIRYGYNSAISGVNWASRTDTTNVELWGSGAGSEYGIHYDRCGHNEISNAVVLGFRPGTHGVGIMVDGTGGNNILFGTNLQFEYYPDAIVISNGAIASFEDIYGSSGVGATPTTALLRTDNNANSRVLARTLRAVGNSWMNGYTGEVGPVSYVAEVNMRSSEVINVPDSDWKFSRGRLSMPPYPLGANAAIPLNNARAQKVASPRAVLLDRLIIDVVAAAANSTVRVAIYRDNNGVPGALYKELGSINTSVAGTVSVQTEHILPPGVWWFALVAQGDGAPTVRTNNGQTNGMSSTDVNGALREVGHCYEQTNISGSFPATFVPTSIKQESQRFVLREKL